MPTGVHEIFIAGVEDAIYTQLKLIRDGSDGAALFAQKRAFYASFAGE
jgi:hypothetical protein